MRATYLSMQSLAGRLTFAIAIGLLSLLVQQISGDDGLTWEALALPLRICAAVAVGGLVLLAATMRWSLSADHEKANEAQETQPDDPDH